MTTNMLKTELERLTAEGGGVLTVDAVLQAAAHPENPLHANFEWNDTLAGAQWRKVQARTLIQRVNITLVQSPANVVRAYVSLPTDRQVTGGGYRLMTAVVMDDILRDELTADIAATVGRWQRKMHLIDAEIASLLTQIEQRLERQSKRPGGRRASAGMTG